MPQIAPTEFRFGDFTLHVADRCLSCRGEPVPLTPKVFDTLLLLVVHSGHLVEKETFFKTLWPDAFVEERSLAQNISILRKSLGEDGNGRRFIETVPKRGYKFVAEVVSVGNGSPALVEKSQLLYPEASAVPQAKHEPEFFPSVAGDQWPGKPQSHSKKWFIALAATGLLLFCATLLIRERAQKSRNSTFQGLDIARLTDTGKAAQVAISADGRYVAYSQRESQGESLWIRQLATGGEVRILPPHADSFYGLTFSPDGNYLYYIPHFIANGGWHSLYVMPILGGASRLLIKDQIDSPISFSPDGRHFAFTNGSERLTMVELHIADEHGGVNRVLTEITDATGDYQPGPAWSPDGRVIAVPVLIHGSYALETISASDGAIHQLYSSPYGIGRPVWTSSKQLIVPLQGRNGRGQLWAISYPGGELERLTNDLEDYRNFGVGYSHEAGTLAAIITSHFSNVWVAQAASPSAGTQLTSGKMSVQGIAPGPLGKILIRGGDGTVSVLNPEDSQRAQFTDARNVLAIASCGRFVVYESNVSKAIDLVRINADGTNPFLLASGDLGPPACSGDDYVFYTNQVKPQTIQRVSINGGTPVEIAESPGLAILDRLSVSPDNKSLAFVYDEPGPGAGTKLAVVSTSSGPILRSYVVPTDVSGLSWSPDGQSVQYLLTRDEVTNIWEQPLDAAQPRQLTKSASGRIFDFNWSPDGKHLLLLRGDVSEDVVLLNNLH